jgi:site-specific DNA-methyltransferase (adenine-specific)
MTSGRLPSDRIHESPSNKTKKQMNTSLTAAENTVITGDCSDVLKTFPPESIDFVLSDPPYLTSYRPRDGRTVANDDDARWLRPAFAELYRVLKPDSICVTFYGWPTADLFVSAFRTAGFRPISHLSFVKTYSSFIGYTQANHEVAYVLAKGSPRKPAEPMSDVLTWNYTGNKLHPTQKPVSVLAPLLLSFSSPGEIILDPFCGSGSTLIAARCTGRRFIGIELDAAYAQLSRDRVAAFRSERAA